MDTWTRRRVFKHGTTHVIATPFVQRKGARTALVTTEGFRDLLEIGRGKPRIAFSTSPIAVSRHSSRVSYVSR